MTQSDINSIFDLDSMDFDDVSTSALMNYYRKGVFNIQFEENKSPEEIKANIQESIENFIATAREVGALKIVGVGLTIRDIYATDEELPNMEGLREITDQATESFNAINHGNMDILVEVYKGLQEAYKVPGDEQEFLMTEPNYNLRHYNKQDDENQEDFAASGDFPLLESHLIRHALRNNAVEVIFGISRILEDDVEIDDVPEVVRSAKPSWEKFGAGFEEFISMLDDYMPELEANKVKTNLLEEAIKKYDERKVEYLIENLGWDEDSASNFNSATNTNPLKTFLNKFIIQAEFPYNEYQKEQALEMIHNILKLDQFRQLVSKNTLSYRVYDVDIQEEVFFASVMQKYIDMFDESDDKNINKDIATLYSNVKRHFESMILLHSAVASDNAAHGLDADATLNKMLIAAIAEFGCEEHMKSFLEHVQLHPLDAFGIFTRTEAGNLDIYNKMLAMKSITGQLSEKQMFHIFRAIENSLALQVNHTENEESFLLHEEYQRVNSEDPPYDYMPGGIQAEPYEREANNIEFLVNYIMLRILQEGHEHTYAEAKDLLQYIKNLAIASKNQEHMDVIDAKLREKDLQDAIKRDDYELFAKMMDCREYKAIIANDPANYIQFMANNNASLELALKIDITDDQVVQVFKKFVEEQSTLTKEFMLSYMPFYAAQTPNVFEKLLKGMSKGLDDAMQNKSKELEEEYTEAFIDILDVSKFDAGNLGANGVLGVMSKILREKVSDHWEIEAGEDATIDVIEELRASLEVALNKNPNLKAMKANGEDSPMVRNAEFMLYSDEYDNQGEIIPEENHYPAQNFQFFSEEDELHMKEARREAEEMASNNASHGSSIANSVYDEPIFAGEREALLSNASIVRYDSIETSSEEEGEDDVFLSESPKEKVFFEVKEDNASENNQKEKVFFEVKEDNVSENNQKEKVSFEIEEQSESQTFDSAVEMSDAGESTMILKPKTLKKTKAQATERNKLVEAKEREGDVTIKPNTPVKKLPPLKNEGVDSAIEDLFSSGEETGTFIENQEPNSVTIRGADGKELTVM